jgi:hypothetical protein
MGDIRFFSLTAASAAALILLALVWPQGEGARSPAPFGHVTAAEQTAVKKANAPKTETVVQPRPVF